jgi:ribosomal-protein-alanine N-acetyltransferase
VIAIRPLKPADLIEVERIQRAHPAAAQWPVADYLRERAFAAWLDGRLAGFAVVRAVAPDELEVLNLAVDPGCARLGIGAALLREVLSGPERLVFLEVRESNAAARALYASQGFRETGRRKKYYPNLYGSGEPEDAVVMNLQK